MNSNFKINGYSHCRLYKFKEYSGYVSITKLPDPLRITLVSTPELFCQGKRKIEMIFEDCFLDIFYGCANFAVVGMRNENLGVDMLIGTLECVSRSSQCSILSNEIAVKGEIDDRFRPSYDKIVANITAKFIRDVSKSSVYLASKFIHNWGIDKYSSLYSNVGMDDKDSDMNTELAIKGFGKHFNTICFDTSIKAHDIPDIKKIIFNDPATIVYWVDGSKTVVKTADGEKFNKEIGLAMAISKKFMEMRGKTYPRAAFKYLVENAIDCSQKTAEKKAAKNN